MFAWNGSSMFCFQVCLSETKNNEIEGHSRFVENRKIPVPLEWDGRKLSDSKHWKIVEENGKDML